MVKVGDKFIIEVKEQVKPKLFDTGLVAYNGAAVFFFEDTLKRCERYNETEAYKKGYAKAMQEAQKAVHTFLAMNCEDREKYFDGEYAITAIFGTYDFREIIEKLEAYEKEQSEIRVGDEIDIDDIRAVVTCVDEGNDRVFVLYVDGYIDEIEGIDENVKPAKTGRHFDEVESLLKILKNMTGGEDCEQISF